MEERHARLFAAAWEEVEAAFLTRLFAAFEPKKGWLERFRAAAGETLALVEEHRTEASFLSVEALSVGELGRERQRAFGRRVAALVDTARAELDDPDEVPEATAEWVVGIFFDRIYRRCAEGSGGDLRRQLPELLFLATAAYFGTEAGLAEILHEE